MPLTTYLARYFTHGARERGAGIARSHGSVLIKTGDNHHVSAKVFGGQKYSVELTRRQELIGISCTCPYFTSEGACKHIWAALIASDRPGYLQPQDLPPPTGLFRNNGHNTASPEPMPEAAPEPLPSLAPPTAPPVKLRASVPEWYQTIESLPRIPVSIPQTEWPSNREIYYLLMGSIKLDQHVGLRICVRDRLKSGAWGKLKTEEVPVRSLSSIPDPLDREILLSLAGPMSYSYSRLDFRMRVELLPGQAEILLPKMCATGRCVVQSSISEEPRLGEPLRWDAGDPWKFRLKPVPEGQYWRFGGYFHRAEERLELVDLRFACAQGILATSSKVAFVEPGKGLNWLGAVWPRSRLLIPIREIPEFLTRLNKAERVPDIEWPAGFNLNEIRDVPRPCLTVREARESSRKNPPYLANLQFDYPDFSISLPADFECQYSQEGHRLIWRHRQAESSLISRLSELGAIPIDKQGPTPFAWEIAGNKLTHLLGVLHKEGWKLESEGKAFRRAGKFEAELSTSIDWFDLKGAMDFEGQMVSLPELLLALSRNERTIILPDGSVGLIPDDFIDKYSVLAGLGATEGPGLRFQRSQVNLLDALLASQPEVHADASFVDYRARLSRFEGIAPADQPAGFVGALRDYQREGLAWLKSLQQMGFGGCLADDMGVGKTAQVLALLESRRELRSNGGIAGGLPGPALVVAPRSVIFNWKQEAARFTPNLRVFDYTQGDRQSNFDQIESHDLVLATYGTLRRDIAELRKIRFDYVVLDEAQAIKNAASDSAKAARLLSANHRVALSGTPVENNLGELGSLFQFLNPGMLGSATASRLGDRNLRNADEATRTLLARALRPFILRRTKNQVARELPSKTEQTVYCEMPHDQRKLYNDLRDHYRRSLLDRVDTAGIGSSRMHILEALLRLRQAACHPGLIDAQRRDVSSAKLDTLMPQIREVIDGGHKLLVFSQFTSFLSIVRERLNREEIQYAYLDGQTTNRQACVEQFQNDPAYPVFLISLKAGGLGLNLTAAEYVFLLDPWWNPAVEAQAIDRTHRIGQTNQVFAYRLISRDTVEEKVMQLQERKRSLADAVLTAENANLNALTRDDLEVLLS